MGACFGGLDRVFSRGLWLSVKGIMQYVYTHEVQVAKTLPIGRIVNPEQMDPPISHFVWSIGLSGYIICILILLLFLYQHLPKGVV